jgi:hypothetical protein
LRRAAFVFLHLELGGTVDVPKDGLPFWALASGKKTGAVTNINRNSLVTGGLYDLRNKSVITGTLCGKFVAPLSSSPLAISPFFQK